MKLYQQLTLFVLAATTVPMIVGLGIIRHSEKMMEGQLLNARQASAQRLAEIIEGENRELLERIHTALKYVDTETMSEDEWKGLLGIVYKQSEVISQVSLLDTEGNEMIPGVFLDAPERYPEYRHRQAISRDDHIHFVKGLPVAQAWKTSPGSVVLGKVQTNGNKPPHLSTLFPVAAQPRRLVAVGWSLSRVLQRISDSAVSQAFSVSLYDEQGNPLAQGENLAASSLISQAAMEDILEQGKQGSFFLGEFLFAVAKVDLTGWIVILSESRDQAWAGVRRSRLVTLMGTGFSILALLVFGGLFTSRINRKLRRVAQGAQAFGRGDLSTRVEVDSKDELGLLAHTFNQMGEELQVSRQEIEEWNQELAQRVEDRTRDLAVAHQRLLQTSKLAAIGQLGAGVAHEVNNPLVGILGNVQLLKMKSSKTDKNLEILDEMECAAKRCRDVIHKLLRFSEIEDDSEHGPCKINQIVRDAFSLTEQRMLAQGVHTHWELQQDLPSLLGDHRQLMQVLLNLFSNALTAMPEGGSLVVRSGRAGVDSLRIEVQDDGVGIQADKLERIFEPFFTTKDVWTNTGLGLSESYRIISDHGGRIEVDSQVGEGSLFRITLPLVAEET